MKRFPRIPETKTRTIEIKRLDRSKFRMMRMFSLGKKKMRDRKTGVVMMSIPAAIKLVMDKQSKQHLP